MRRITVVAAVLFAAALAGAPNAAAHEKGERLCHRFEHRYYFVERHYGRDAAGVNICTRGVAAGTDQARQPTKEDREIALRRLKPWADRALAKLHRQAILRARDTSPYRPPAGTATLKVVPGAQLQAIAECESGGNPGAIGGGGQFRGKYQFTYATWASVGGSGDPALAPEAEQDRRAAMLLASSGSSPWPVCG